MPNVTYFVQDCPTCGRKLNVRVEYLGRKVVCQHCRGAFVAWDPEGAPPVEGVQRTSETTSDVVPSPSSSNSGVLSSSASHSNGLSNSSLSGTKLLDRAQELIEMAERKIAESRIIRAKIDVSSADTVH